MLHVWVLKYSYPIESLVQFLLSVEDMCHCLFSFLLYLTVGNNFWVKSLICFLNKFQHTCHLFLKLSLLSDLPTPARCRCWWTPVNQSHQESLCRLHWCPGHQAFPGSRQRAPIPRFDPGKDSCQGRPECGAYAGPWTHPHSERWEDLDRRTRNV